MERKIIELRALVFELNLILSTIKKGSERGEIEYFLSVCEKIKKKAENL